ncbi:hypothetical protein [Acidocella facilis]|uniref:hypothetical protein n=1 Tax=Acidocella facilis TaxID=525 RepID=UPI001F36ECAE|nr:hypothetical protein [Acidocella facilis]
MNNNHISQEDGNVLPWPDFISGVRRFAYAVWFTLIGLGMLVTAAVYQYDLSSSTLDFDQPLIAGAIPLAIFVMIIAWNGPYRKRRWAIGLTFILARAVFILTLLGQSLFWIWAARLHPAFDLINPSFGDNPPAMTAFCLICATICATTSLLIGYRNRWFRGLW